MQILLPQLLNEGLCLMLKYLTLLATVVSVSACSGEPTANKPAVDAPELAALGAYKIGTMVETISVGTSRTVSVRLWYPATEKTGAAAIVYHHKLPLFVGKSSTLDVTGLAVTEAVPVSGKHFPLVVISHGFQGGATYFAYLGENLASKGYVVAAIEHDDKFIYSKGSFVASFADSVTNRTQDQRATIATLVAEAKTPNHPAATLIDADHIGIIGYSMGGFGALATAGAAYDAASTTIAPLPLATRTLITSPDVATASQIKALVTIAPWGGQPSNRSWTTASLATITAPVLMIDGDHDDVANFKEGVSWIFDSLSGTNRKLLVYRDALHNVAGNPLPNSPETHFQAYEYLNEPVWRSERINAINIHFITAFLDLNLKGDAAKAAYLNVPTPIAGDGDWPQAFGEQNGGRVAGDKEQHYWRGFQRRWALGLELRQHSVDQ